MDHVGHVKVLDVGLGRVDGLLAVAERLRDLVLRLRLTLLLRNVSICKWASDVYRAYLEILGDPVEKVRSAESESQQTFHRTA